MFDALDAVEAKSEEFRQELQPTIDKFNEMIAFLEKVRDIFLEFDDFRM